jgi:hypothetical protein
MNSSKNEATLSLTSQQLDLFFPRKNMLSEDSNEEQGIPS